MEGPGERIRYELMAPRPAGDPSEPIDLRTMFPDESGELELDIGFGHGSSIYERAARAPTARILGVEVKSKWAYKVSEKCKRDGLDRVRILTTDVRTLLPRLGPDGCLARAFVHFPDPWWKRRHQHRMVLGDALLDQLARLFRAGADLYVQTDVEARAVEYRDAIARHPAFVLATDTGFIDTNPFGARSNREKRAAEDGLPVYRVLAHRRGLATKQQDGRCGA